MITLSAKIKMLSSESGTLSAVGYLNGNNISSEIPLGEKKQAKSPFFIGSSRFNGERFLKSVDYFIGSEISDENGNFETTYSFTITGKNISIFTIAFNDEKNSHPKSIIVDGVEYYDDDAIFTIETSLSDTHSIIINNWNKPLEPLVITGIYINYSLSLIHI